MSEENTVIKSECAPVPTKFCSRCKRELPVSAFYKSTKSADGLQSYCIECSRQAYKERSLTIQAEKADNIRLSPPTLKGDPSSPLGNVHTRDLLAELQSRGFHGEFTFLYKVTI